MNKEFKKLLKELTRLKKAFESEKCATEEGILSLAYRFDDIVNQMSAFLSNYTFESEKKEQKFYTNQITSMYVNHFAVAELSLILCHIPFGAVEREKFLMDKINQLNQYKVTYYKVYKQFLANDYAIDKHTFIQFYGNAGNIDTWHIFDEQHPEMLPIYFAALIIILERLQILYQRNNSPANVESTTSLTWHWTKTDLCVLIYALSEMMKEKDDLIRSG